MNVKRVPCSGGKCSMVPRLLLILAALILSACGEVEIGIEATPTARLGRS